MSKKSWTTCSFVVISVIFMSLLSLHTLWLYKYGESVGRFSLLRWGPLSAYVLWLILSIKIIGPDEMGVLVWFGDPKFVYESGFCFVPFLPGLKCYIEILPQKMFKFGFPESEVITKAGIFDDVYYSSQILAVDADAYVNFPRPETPMDPGSKTHPLCKILKSSIPIDEEGLERWVKDAVIAAKLQVFSEMTYKEAVENRKTVNEGVNAIFCDPDGPLMKAGFRTPGIKLVITAIKLPEELKKALKQLDITRLEIESAKNSAKTRAIKAIGTIIAMMAESRGVDAGEIQEGIKKNAELQKQFMDYAMDKDIRVSEAELGALLDVRTPNAKGLLADILPLVSLLRMVPVNGNKNTDSELSSVKTDHSESAKKEKGKKHAGEEISTAAAEKYFNSLKDEIDDLSQQIDSKKG